MLFYVLIQCFKNIAEFKIFGRQVFEILFGFTSARIFKLHLLWNVKCMFW